MKTRLVITLLLALSLLSARGASAGSMGIPNPSFEDDSGWAFSTTGSNWWSYGYATEWATDGLRSMKLFLPGGEGGIYLPGANTYAQVSEQVDLTGAKELWFDLQAWGDWDHPEMGSDYYNSMEILVDDTIVYGMERQTGIFLSQAAQIGGFDGAHTLTIRLRNHADFASPTNVGRGMLIDNLRLATTKVFLPGVRREVSIAPPCSALPTLVAPANGANLNSILPLFEWENPVSPDATTLRLQIAKDSGFTQPVTSLWSGAYSGPGSFRFTNNFQPAATYYWRGFFLCGSATGPYTPVWSFTTGSGGVILPAPVLSSPANGSNLAGRSTLVKWSAVNGALEYFVFATIPGSGGRTYWTTTDTQVTVSGLDPSTTYEWYVVARNDYALGAESAHWQFKTGAASGPAMVNCRSVMVQDLQGTVAGCALGGIR